MLLLVFPFLYTQKWLLVLSFGLELVDIVNSDCSFENNLRLLLLLILHDDEFIVHWDDVMILGKKTALFWLTISLKDIFETEKESNLGNILKE